MAEHKDISDEGQTVLITERNHFYPYTATSEDGKKEIEAGKDVTIIDTVTLDGLEIGTKYQFKGWQMIKDENAELIINGERVENDYTLLPTVKVWKSRLPLHSTLPSLAGKELVTFEELYDLSNPDEPTKVTEHKDIEDDRADCDNHRSTRNAGRTYAGTADPTRYTDQTSDAPKTGDNTNIALFLGLLVLSGAGVAGTYFFKRRKRS